MWRALLAAVMLTGVVHGQSLPSGSRWKTIFQEADKNGDGVITLDESDHPRLFRKLDLDGDGRITPEEARAGVASRRGDSSAQVSPAASSPSFSSHLNLPYAKIPGADPNLLSLDVYSPAPPVEGGAPVVIMVHGGGWRAGDKASGAVGREKAAFFTAEGFVYVSVNYRLAPAVQHPVHAGDVARAVAWVFRHIKSYGGDSTRVYLMGHSAGAHLAALVATDERHLAAEGLSPSRLSGVILLDTAGYDIARNMGELSEGMFNRALYENAFGKDPAVWKDASPVAHVKKGKELPRFLIFHTDRKSSGPISQDFAAALRKSGTSASAVLARGKTHTTLNRDIGKADDGPSRLILEFLRGANSFPEAL